MKRRFLSHLKANPTLRRLIAMVRIASNGCWIWRGCRDRDGYGRFFMRGTMWMAHRAAYTLFIREIAPGACLDHRCRKPACVNPWHLDEVSRGENTLKGLAPSAINARKRHCKHGHPFDHRNTYRFGNRRACRTCNAAAVRRYKARGKGARR